MKQNYFNRFPRIVSFFCLTLTFLPLFTIAQNTKEPRKPTKYLSYSGNRNSDDDAKLAALIRKLTDRSSEGIVIRSNADGSFSADLMGKFQNVVLGKLGIDGEPIAACIGSIGEANQFLGRDLDTGKVLDGPGLVPDTIQEIAKRHGMSVEEFRYYSQMISDYQHRQFLISPGSANIIIQNNDGVAEGFNDIQPAFVIGEGGNPGLTRGAQRLNVFNQAASIWGSFLDSAVQIQVRAQFDPMTPCSTSGGVLGSSGTTTVHRNFPNAGFTDTWYPQALANKQAGSDLSANPDINSTFNTNVDNECLGTGTRFYYGFDNAVPPGRINLLVVVLHEMGHGLGFQTFVNGTTGQYFSSFPDIFLLRMYDRSQNLYWNQMTNAQRSLSAVNPNNVLFDSPSIRLESAFLTAGRETSTGRVELYTPNPFQSGSSLSHFNTAATPNLLMEPAINPGLGLDLDLTRQVMRDLGWYRDTTADSIPDSIINVTPNNGSVNVGQQIQINWTNTGGFNKNVTIDLSTNGGSTWSPIVSDISNTGSYTWTVPNSPTSQARLRVREAGFAEPAGISSGNFSILAAPSSASVSVSGRVFDAAGRAIKGATVVFTDGNGVARSAKTNSFGYFAVDGLPSGRQYFVNIMARGHLFLPFAIDVAEDVGGLMIVASN